MRYIIYLLLLCYILSVQVHDVNVCWTLKLYIGSSVGEIVLELLIVVRLTRLHSFRCGSCRQSL